MSEIQALEIQIPREIIQYWGLFLAFGIGMLLLGVAAVVRSVTATVVSMLFFGWLLVLASGIEIAQAVMVGRWAGFFQHLLAAILFGVAGLLIVTRPLKSAEVVTLFVGMFPRRWPVSACRLGGACAARLGLAGGGWSDHVCAGPAGPCGMARLGTLGDRALSRH
jgi:uncharacterized membrane protein HdeD (DUF308 family)